jgi:hypothetical protein
MLIASELAFQLANAMFYALAGPLLLTGIEPRDWVPWMLIANSALYGVVIVGLCMLETRADVLASGNPPTKALAPPRTPRRR